MSPSIARFERSSLHRGCARVQSASTQLALRANCLARPSQRPHIRSGHGRLLHYGQARRFDATSRAPQVESDRGYR